MESIKLITIPNAFDRSNKELSFIEYHNESLLDIRNMYFPSDVDVVVSVNGIVIPQEDFCNTYIKNGQEILFVPNIHGGGSDGGKAIMASLLMIAVVIAAPYAAGLLGLMGEGAALGSMAGLTVAGKIFAGSLIMGAGLLVNSLLPQPTLATDDLTPSSAAYGWNPQTVCEQGRVVPKYYGTFKLYGNIINSFITNKKDQQYLSSLIDLGLGPYSGLSNNLDSVKINNLPISRYYITPEVRDGYITQTLITEFSNTKSTDSMDERIFNVQSHMSIHYQNGQFVRVGSDDETAKIYQCINEGPNAMYIQTAPPSQDWTEICDYIVQWDIGLTGYTTYEIDISAPYGCYTTMLDNKILPSTVYIYMQYKEEADASWTSVLGENGEAYAFTIRGAMAKPVRFTRTITGLSETGVYYLRFWRKERSGFFEMQDATVSHETHLTAIRSVVPDDFVYPRHALIGVKALAVANLSGEFNFSIIADCSKVAVYTSSTAYTITHSDNPAWVMWDIVTQPVIDSIGGVDTIVRYDGIHPSKLDYVKFKELADWCDVVVDENAPAASIVSFEGITYTAKLDHLSNDDNKPPNSVFWEEGDSTGTVLYDVSHLLADNKCVYGSSAKLEFTGADFSTYAAKTPAYKVVMTDSNGKTAMGYLGVATSIGGGESLGTEVVVNGDFTSNINNWSRIGESSYFTHSAGTMRVAGGSTPFDAPTQLYDTIPKELQTSQQAISSGDYSIYTKGNAFDQYLDSWWGSSLNSGHSGVCYIGQNYGKKTIISKIIITHKDMVTKMPVFKFQYSDNGSTWTDIQTYTDSDPSLLTQEITVLSYPGGIYFRLLAMYNITGLRWWVKDIKTIGIQPTDPVNPPTPPSTGVTKYFYQALALRKGSLYKVSCDIPYSSGTKVRQFIGPDYNNPNTAIYSTGVRGSGTNISGYFVCADTARALYISHEDTNASGGYSTWDNISVKPVTEGGVSTAVLVYRNPTRTSQGWIEQAGFNRNSAIMQVTISSQTSANADPWKVGEFYYGTDSASSKRITFNGGFEEGTTVWEALMEVCQLARCVPIWKGTTLSLAIDKESTPVQTFSMGNMLKNSFKLSYLSKEERASEIEIDYIDKDLDYERTKLIVFDHDLPNQTSKASLSLKGIVSKHLALRSGLYRLYCNKYLIRHVSFDADIDAIACTVGDRVYVENDVPLWNTSGRIASVLSSTSFTLDKTLVVSGTCVIMVTTVDGTSGQVLQERTITNAAGTYAAGSTINVSSAFSPAMQQFDVYFAGSLDKHIYTITSIKKNGDFTVNLEGLQYDERVYDCDNYSMYKLPTT